MNTLHKFVLLFVIIIFLLGLYWFVNKKPESFEMTNPITNCPNLLIRRGNILLLYDTTQPIVDGSNPIPFYNLDEYIQYVNIQREKGVDCPVLFLQQENNAQGQDVYRVRPSPFNLQGGLPPMSVLYQNNGGFTVPPRVAVSESSNDGVFAFDSQGQNIGIYTNVDKLHHSTKNDAISDNPMDANWGGVVYTQQMVDSGKYADNNVSRPVYSTATTALIPLSLIPNVMQPAMPNSMQTPIQASNPVTQENSVPSNYSDNQPTSQPTPYSTTKPISQPTPYSTTMPISQPTPYSTTKPISQPTPYSTTKPISQPPYSTTKPISQPTPYSTTKPISQATVASTTKPISQATVASTTKPISQTTSQTSKTNK